MKKLIQLTKNSFIKGGAFALGLFATGLFAAVISGTVSSFTAGEVIDASRMNANFTALSTAITGNGTYSTSEVNTEKEWIDGKKIYRKVVTVASLPNNSTLLTAHNIAGSFTIISARGMATDGTTRFSMPKVDVGVHGNGIELVVTATDVSIDTDTDLSAYTGFVILEYTK